MLPPRALALLVLLLAPLGAGCIESPLDAAAAPAETPRLPGQGIDESLLTEPTYGELPKERVRIPAWDGITLHADVYLPDGPGPWPTILINSPYNLHPAEGTLNAVSHFDMKSFFVPRGYAVVFADVRGTGDSEGCMNMMGEKEQRDTYDLVEWIANRSWSDGKVGMYGVSYVGTTPQEAAIMAPPHLVTVVPVAGVTNQWRNTFMNGVPYQGRFYPLTYNLFGALPPGDVSRGPAWAVNAAAALCEQEEAVRATSPGVYEKGVYDAYWAERNLTSRTANVTASVFYNQGFTDRAVNPMEIVHWFNELDVPKKAFLGQWAHRTPARDDWTLTLHAWFDHWLKGIENGVMGTPTVEVLTNVATVRVADEWPPRDAVPLRLHLSRARLSEEPPKDGSETYVADMGRNPFAWRSPLPGGVSAPDPTSLLATTELAFETEPLGADVHMAGIPLMHLEASVDAANTYFLLDIYDVVGDAWTPITEGWMNAHLHESFDRSTPLEPGERYRFFFKFEPREYVFEEGHRIGLRIHGHDERVYPVDELITRNTVFYGAVGSVLELPVLVDPSTHEVPEGV